MVQRVIPAAAIGTIRQLAGDLARWSRQAGHLSAHPTLTADIERLASSLTQPSLHVDVLCDGSAAASLDQLSRRLSPRLTRDAIADGLASGIAIELPGGPGLRALRLSVSRSRRIEKAGDIRAPILIIAGSTTTDEAFMQTAVSAAEDRPLVLVSAPDANAASAFGAAAWWAGRLSPTEADQTLEERLAAPPLADVVDLLVADGAARAVSSLGHVFLAALDHEFRSLKARRVMVQQSSEHAPARSTSAADVIADIRARLQRHFAEFARGIDERRAAAFAPLTGTIWLEVEKELERLTALTFEQRAKTNAASVPKEFEERWLATARDRMSRECVKDLDALRDLFQLARTEIDQTLASAGGPPVVVAFQFLGDERLQRLLSLHVAIQRRYAGELPRPGAFEYMMIARRYQMILFMFISAFGLSFVRTYRQIMLPSAIVLLSLGALSVYNSVRRERAETQVREIEKARDILRSELRRMLSEVMRGWAAIVSQHLNDQIASAVTQIESVVREHHTRDAHAAAEDRARVQRQLQGMDTVERRLQPAARGCEAVLQTITEFRRELRHVFLAALRNPGPG